MRAKRKPAACRAVAPLILEVVDPDVDERVLRVVELHAIECDACRDELDRLRVALGLLEALEEVEASPDFEARVAARVRAQRLGRWSWDDLWARVLEALAARPFRTAGLAGALTVASVMLFRLQDPAAPVTGGLLARIGPAAPDVGAQVLAARPGVEMAVPRVRGRMPVAVAADSAAGDSMTQLAVAESRPQAQPGGDELGVVFDALEARLAEPGAQLPTVDPGPWPSYAPGEIVPAALGTPVAPAVPESERRRSF
jgi:hypothetical protein